MEENSSMKSIVEEALARSALEGSARQGEFLEALKQPSKW
jgi:cell division protein FtsZ